MTGSSETTTKGVEPSTSDVLRIAVMSDLHAFDKNATTSDAPSFFDVSEITTDPLRSPTAGLERLLVDDKLRADVLLVGGDISDKAHPNGLKRAWDWVNAIATRMGVDLIAAAPGNHDMDSRYIYNAHDARGVLLQLAPLFPLPTRSNAVNDHFWARNFVILDESRFRLVILNSAAYHGGADREIDHGRISDHTLVALRALLQEQGPRVVNILLCHHHPKYHHELGTLDDYEYMRNGDQLMQTLGDGSFGEWLIIHGHKHFPKLEYGAGGSSSPVIFGAGSFSAVIYPEIAGRARNQFYIIDVEAPSSGGLRGSIRAWDFALGQGWRRAQRYGSGLPFRAGFGWRGSIAEMAARVAAHVLAPLVPWENLAAAVPELSYLIPTDLEAVVAKLQTTHKIRVFFGDDGTPLQIGRTS